MELSDRPLASSDLIGVPVVDQSGRKLGRVFDLRAHRDRDGVIVVDQLMIGPRALLGRLRGPSAEAAGIPWASIVELNDDRIMVHKPSAS
jgi:sporulation protein YlmC with PRC-barrel domain